MNSTYQNSLKASLAQRKEITIMPMGHLIAFLVMSVSFYILLSVVVAPDYFKEYHFENERGAITVLSAIFLAMASGFAGAGFFLSDVNLSWLRYFWLLAALVLGFFALDELIGFHEKAGEWLDHSSLGPTQTFRNWNDVVVISYGVIALCVLSCFLPEILRYPKYGELLALAFFFYCLHTGIDSTQEPKTTISIILEESAKLFCSLFLAVSMFVGLFGVVARRQNA